MRSLQHKLLLYVVIIGLVPMLFFTFYYYDLLKNDNITRLENESQTYLEQLDNKLVVKASKIQNMVDIFFVDADFCRTLHMTGSNKEADFMTQEKLDSIYERFSRGERELSALILFPVSGGYFISGDTSVATDPQSLIMEYDNSQLSAGTLSWMGLKNRLAGYEKSMVLAGTMIRDNTYLKDERYLGTIYMIFSDSIFGGGLQDSMEGYLAGDALYYSKDTAIDSESISIYDEKINLIYSVGSTALSNAYILSQTEGRRIDRNNFVYSVDIDGSKYMVVSYTSRVTGWKFARTFPYKRYEEGNTNIAWVMLICFMIMLGVWYVVNHFVVKRMTLPVRQLLDAMWQVENNNLDVKLDVNSKSDFGLINKGFNNMLKQIKSLFNRILSVERKRREQEILMLRYQMNPHFLYNTISAIRLTAIMNKQTSIADMLLILGRFLRKAILTANEILDVKTEIENINDYVSLQQLRYMNAIDFAIEADESIYSVKIPGMLCQPIIENSIMHGLSDRLSKGSDALIRMKFELKGDFLEISVFDNGKGIPPDRLERLFEDDTDHDSTDRHHIGLKNIRKRLQLIFGEQCDMTVDSQEGLYTMVRLRLPKDSENIQNNLERGSEFED